MAAGRRGMPRDSWPAALRGTGELLTGPDHGSNRWPTVSRHPGGVSGSRGGEFASSEGAELDLAV